MPNWTKEQENAIEIRGKNLLVSAAAGSGKTAVLVERIIRMLIDEENPVDIDKIVVVTFTNAAANQMKDKIYNRISKALLDNPGNERLIRALSLVHSSKIMTIDSFCLDIIRENFNELDLEPGFRVIDMGELELLKADVMESLLGRYYDEKDKDFYTLVKKYGGSKNDKRIEEIILELYKTAISFPWPHEWLDECLEFYDVETFDDFLNLPVCVALFDNISNRAKAVYEEFVSLTYDYENVKLTDTIKAAIPIALNNLKLLMDKSNYIDIGEKLLSYKLSGGKTKEEHIPYKNAISLCRDFVNEVKENYFYKPLMEIYNLEKLNGKVVKMIVKLTKDFMDELDMMKRKKNVIDFSDMEHLALNILVKRENHKSVYTQIADELARNYAEIFVDEYQDSNEVQENILYAISKGRLSNKNNNMFMVGDVKQSIYKFRMARPELFVNKYNTYPDYEECREDSDCVKVELNKNFRSGIQILESVNEIFMKIMRPQVGNVDYTDKVKLNLGRDAKDFVYNENFATDIYIIDSDNLDNDDDLTKHEMEATFAANKIKAIVNNPDYMIWDEDAGSMREVTYRDIVILMASPGKCADTYVDILTRSGIPAYFNSDVGYFQAKEIRDVLNLLRIIDNPRQDIALAGCLMSYFGGFDANDLAKIKSFYEDKALYDCLLKCMDGGFDELSDKCSAFLNLIEVYRTRASYVSVGELVYDIVYNSGYYEYMDLLGNEKVRKSNLDILANKAKVYEKTSYVGLFNFLRYIEKLNKYEVDYSNATATSEYDDIVRIMSIHHSKGLEFPVVIVSELGAKFNDSEEKAICVIDPKLHIAVDYVDIKERTKTRSIFKKLIKEKIRTDSRGESLRLLYVALTRAKDKLVLVGSAGKLDNKWQEGIYDQEAIKKAGTFLDIFMPFVSDESEYFGIHIVDEVISELEDTKVQETRKERKYIEVEYPYANATVVKSKYSVSEIKHGFEEEMPNPYSSYEKTEGKEVTNDGAKRGTAYHKIMELLDYSKVDTLEDIVSQIEGLNVEYKAHVEPKKILAFCESDLGKRIKKAYMSHKLYREQPFVMGDKGRNLGVSILSESDEFVLVQGVIDLFFFENNEVVLLDYKTDNVLKTDTLVERYERQLKQYEVAIYKALGVHVKETFIYSFALDKTIKL